MSLWLRIKSALAEFGQGNPLVGFFMGPPEESVAFTISIISLSAKMAKADGTVTRDEVRTLREIFNFADEDEDDIARVFDLARQDVAGYREYARKIRKMFVGRPEMLRDIFESLFQIALSDGEFHENEDQFLTEVLGLFELPDIIYLELKDQYLKDCVSTPYKVLGVTTDASGQQIRSAYKKILRENHPDSLLSRGLPQEAMALAENRIRAAAEAYEALGRPK